MLEKYNVLSMKFNDGTLTFNLGKKERNMMSKDAKSCETCGLRDDACNNCEGCVDYSMWTTKSQTRSCDSISGPVDSRVDELFHGNLYPEPWEKGKARRASTPQHMSKQGEDMVRDPKARYYDAGGLETIDIIKAKLTPDQYRGWLLGNLIKYSCRANHKGQFNRDVEKVKFYSAEMFKVLEV